MSEQKTGPREVTIKIPRLTKDKGLLLAGGTGFLIAFIFAASVLKELNDLKKQQQTAEDRVKKEVLMPGGTTEYKTEFKSDSKRDTAKDSVTTATAPAAIPAPVPPEPVATTTPDVPQRAQTPASGPGNFGDHAPQYSSGPTGPGNM